MICERLPITQIWLSAGMGIVVSLGHRSWALTIQIPIVDAARHEILPDEGKLPSIPNRLSIKKGQEWQLQSKREPKRVRYDVDENGTINPLNVLAIVNFMNLKANGEGEDEDLQLRPAPNEVALEDASLLVAGYMQIEEKTCLVTISRLGDSASLSLA